MKIKQVMTTAVETISPNATVEQAARLMRDRDVGILPVVEERTILGVVTDRDLLLRAIAEGRNPHLTTVRDVMTPQVFSCYEDQSITETAMLMEKKLVHRLFVLDRNEKLAGVVSISDLAARFPNDRVSGHVLRNISTAA